MKFHLQLTSQLNHLDEISSISSSDSNPLSIRSLQFMKRKSSTKLNHYHELIKQYNGDYYCHSFPIPCLHCINPFEVYNTSQVEEKHASRAMETTHNWTYASFDRYICCFESMCNEFLY